MRNEATIPGPRVGSRGIVPAPLRGLVQTGSFIGKELSEVCRQPKLILSLIAGPFLLLFLFGMGYSPKPPLVRTLVVVPPNSQYQAEIEKRKDAFGEPFLLEGITTDAAEARRKLENREVGALIYFPEDPCRDDHQGAVRPAPARIQRDRSHQGAVDQLLRLRADQRAE
ncbi:MAG: hypothetical protein U0841_09800 [Chloroflexia bacterium]